MHVCWIISVAVSYLRCVMNGGRERRARVSPWQPTCLWPFIKPGGVEEREGLTVTDRALCRTRGGPCCLLTQTAPHAQLQNGASMQTASAATQHNWCPSHSFNVLRIPHWTSRLLRRQVAMPMYDTHPTTHPEGYVTHPQTQRTCSSIRQTGPNAERLKPNSEWSRTHRECEVEEVNLRLE